MMKKTTTRLAAVVLGFLIAAPVFADGSRDSARLDEDLKLVARLRSEGRDDMALTLASRIVAVNPTSLEAHLAYQDLRIAKGETAALVREYSKRQSGSDVTADDVFLHARLLSSNRRAISGFKRALKLDPNHFPALCALGARQVESGDLDGAGKNLALARRLRPESGVPVNLLGRAAEVRGDPGRAERLYRTAAKLAPTDPLPVLNLGVLLMGLERYDDALPVLEEANRLDPTDPMPLLVLGMCFAARGDLESAVAEYKEAVELPSNTVDSLNMLGSAYIGLEQFDLAKKALDKALDAAPKSVPTLLNLCYLELRQNRVAEAAQWVKKARKLDPRSAQACYFAGLCEEFLGRQKAAEQAYRRAVTLDEGNPDYWRALGTFYSNLTRYRDAVKAYTKVVTLTDRSVPALTDLAFAWVGRGDPKKAITCFEEVIEAEPDNLTAWMNIGLIYQEKLSDRDQAIRAYQEYLKRGGEDERVKKWLEELRAGK